VQPAVQFATGGETGKRFLLGTHRISSPLETWERLVRVCAAVGITRVADVTRLDHLGVPVYQAIRPQSRNLSVSQGKGMTPEAARVSAVMESIELWHAEDLAELPQVTMPIREMDYGNPIPLGSLRWLADALCFESTPISWIRLRSLTRDRSGWVPRDMVELDFSLATSFQPRMFLRTSNGLAAGNCREEALLHALCELVERHAVFLAEREPQRRRRIAPSSVPAASRELLSQLEKAGAKVALYDVTFEVGLAVVQAELIDADLPVVWRGSGCHPAPDVALSRALTEAAQSRLTFISGARDDLPELASGQIAMEIFDGFAPPPPGSSFGDLPPHATATVADDLRGAVTLLARAGYEPFSVDLTRPEIGIPVVLAFVPGLMEMPHA
jgi:ribosomal protein S12 methylthiotransferase accessory factor